VLNYKVDLSCAACVCAHVCASVCVCAALRLCGSAALRLCGSLTAFPPPTTRLLPPPQVLWRNKAGMREVLPPGSRNPRFYCKSCGSYVAEDACRPLGILALPLSAAAAAHAQLTAVGEETERGSD
jgi:hypothetical protein